MRTRILTLAAALLLVPAAVPAHAGRIDQNLHQARSARASAVLRVERMQRELDAGLSRYSEVEASVGRAAMAVVQAFSAQRAASDRLAQARESFEARTRAVYELGPGGSLEAMLGAKTLAEVSAVQEYTAKALESQADALELVQQARSAVTQMRVLAEERQSELARREAELAPMLGALQSQLDDAIATAAAAGLRINELESRRREIAQARARAQAREQALATSPVSGAAGPTTFTTPSNVENLLQYGEDQQPFLDLLGAEGGRSCDIPSGLRDTGENVAGDATWYGWDAAGGPTASGNVFDPMLMTAANRWLPLGSFLRVRYRDRCVIVLVNDRGPYGDLHRVIDLSLGAAKVLGTVSMGVAPVTADVLVPRSSTGVA